MSNVEYIQLIQMIVLAEADRLGLIGSAHEDYVEMITNLMEELLLIPFIKKTAMEKKQEVEE